MTDSFKSELQSLYVHKNQFEVSWETLMALYVTPGDFFFLNCTNTTNINVSFHLFPYF